MSTDPTPGDLARDLLDDLKFIREKKAIGRPAYDVDDDVEIAFRAVIEDAWPIAIRRALAAETAVTQVRDDALRQAIALCRQPYSDAVGCYGYDEPSVVGEKFAEALERRLAGEPSS